MINDAARTTGPAHPIRALLALLVTFVAVIAGLLLPATAATAAELPGAVSSVTLDESHYGYNDRQTVTFDWSVPDSAGAGDTFTFPVPAELSAVSQAPFALKDAAGAVVANAKWVQQPDKSWSIVFTLTDYADTHDNVGGSAHVSTQWNHSVVTTTGGAVNLQFDANAVQVTIDPKPTPTPPCTTNCPPPTPPATSQPLSKSGGWTDGTFEGTSTPDDNINWTVKLLGNPTGYAGPITVADTPAAGSVIDCATIVIRTQDSLANGTKSVVVDPARWTVDCTPSTFTITLDQIAPSEFITVAYKGTITDQASGSYGNHVEFSAPGTTLTKDATRSRTDQGGDGGGVQSVSVGDYVWLDADHDGIQDGTEKGIAGVTLVLTGPDGKPVTSVSGSTVAPVVTDTNGHYAFTGLPVLPAGQHYTVTIDQTASATALQHLVPTVAGAGSDRGKDSSTGSATSTDLTTNGANDPTLDFGFVGEVSVGDYVWFDGDADGIQSTDEKGIAGVTLDLTGPDGLPVTDVTGKPVAPTVTDTQGRYLFEHLPTLPAGQHYTVAIDPVASAAALVGYTATKADAGSDTAKDSSTGSAESTDLTVPGSSDLTLDFGFTLQQLPTLALPEDPAPATTTAQLAHTGVDGVIPAALGAGGLILLGLIGFAISRRRQVAGR